MNEYGAGRGSGGDKRTDGGARERIGEKGRWGGRRNGGGEARVGKKAWEFGATGSRKVAGEGMGPRPSGWTRLQEPIISQGWPRSGTESSRT